MSQNTQDAREDVFSMLLTSGAVESTWLKLDPNGAASIIYRLRTGALGSIYTKRGERKVYRLETALRFLRSLSIQNVTVEMTDWQLSDGSSTE